MIWVGAVHCTFGCRERWALHRRYIHILRHNTHYRMCRRNHHMYCNPRSSPQSLVPCIPCICCLHIYNLNSPSPSPSPYAPGSLPDSTRCSDDSDCANGKCNNVCANQVPYCCPGGKTIDTTFSTWCQYNRDEEYEKKCEKNSDCLSYKCVDSKCTGCMGQDSEGTTGGCSTCDGSAGTFYNEYCASGYGCTADAVPTFPDTQTCSALHRPKSSLGCAS